MPSNKAVTLEEFSVLKKTSFGAGVERQHLKIWRLPKGSPLRTALLLSYHHHKVQTLSSAPSPALQVNASRLVFSSLRTRGMRKNFLASLHIFPQNRPADGTSSHPKGLYEMSNFRNCFSKFGPSRTKGALNKQKIRFCLSNMQVPSDFNDPNSTVALICSVSHYSITLQTKKWPPLCTRDLWQQVKHQSHTR